MKTKQKEEAKRHQLIRECVARRLSGLRNREIAKEIGINADYVSQLIRQAPTLGLSTVCPNRNPEIERRIEIYADQYERTGRITYLRNAS